MSILKEAQEAFALCAEREAENRAEALEDLRFARLGEQWPEKVRAQRELEGRPCLTINRLPAFIRQVVNDGRLNRPQIKVHPQDSAADPATAEVMSGLIRNIEVSSDAEVAYDTALEFAATCGLGYFRINTTYARDDGFEQDIVIQRVANPFGVYADPYSTAADSADWDTAFVVERLPIKVFEKRWKGAGAAGWEAGGYDGLEGPWRSGEEVLIAEYWTRSLTRRAITALSNGQVVELEAFKANREWYVAHGIEPVGVTRDVAGYKVVQHILTGAEVLETNPWAGRFIPIVPVFGEEIFVEGRRRLRSLVRGAKDAQMMFNYWRTTSTELVALAPRAPFIGPKGAFESDAGKWETMNAETHAFVEYDGAVAPQRQPFAGSPPGALQEALNAADDIKSIIGLHDASLGARSNETSGVAINARQREGDVSTFHFIDNLSRAIRHAGRIIIDLIPKVYSDARMVRTLGAEGEARAVSLNTPVAEVDEASGEVRERVYDLALGKYDLTVTAGPSFTTRRQEAAAQMTELIRAFPPAAPVLGDLLARNLDWPGADEIAQRLRGLTKGAAPDGPSPAEAALRGQVAALAERLEGVMADRTLEARRVAVDEFNAQTARMKVV